ncbi:hypothetical protein CONLIGDRAFT_687843 [Coniochaeta ligniaria NRRL 30616]|uniref:Uncharacterized protein n=1 Tax=Coniochaeta ligniaria NRRL 30616 TaxID=1408157 RepID=A0A1J7ILX0_9PEZI|nr:hypothetical protein CONLIGDRAFT_687843 [Coniochaeta ligniaria NRRL 30616]
MRLNGASGSLDSRLGQRRAAVASILIAAAVVALAIADVVAVADKNQSELLRRTCVATVAALQQPTALSEREQKLAKESEELWEVINEQRALQK